LVNRPEFSNPLISLGFSQQSIFSTRDCPGLPKRLYKASDVQDHKTALGYRPETAFVTALEKSHGQNCAVLAARMRNAASDVPDLVQEVYLRLLRLDNTRPFEIRRPYLYTVASHVLHQHALRQAAAGESADITDIAASLSAAGGPRDGTEIEQQFESSAGNSLSFRRALTQRSFSIAAKASP